MIDTDSSLVRRWRRRWWRADAAALEVFVQLRPFVVVTGASAGIGLAFAQSYVRSGHDVLIIARDRVALGKAADAIKAEGCRGHIETLPLDVASADAALRLDEKLKELGGFVDILVNNAGIGFAGRFASQPEENLDALLQLNVVALTRLCRHVLPGQLVRGRGGIINVGSIGGLMPGPNQAAYYASKAFVISLSEALTVECVGQGVRVMAVVPGPVETAFHTKMGADAAFYRVFLPSLDAAAVAWSSRLAFSMGQRVAIPGVVNRIIYAVLRFLPHRLLLPLIAELLKPRGK